MKRFWKEARAAQRDDGWGIELDSRTLKTPARSPLVLPTKRLGQAVLEEWSAAGETIDPRAMPTTGLANAAVDRVAPDKDLFAAGLGKYAEADLLCYRAERPAKLVERQAALWDPTLDWARRRFDVDFRITSGVIHVDQPPATIARLRQAVAALDAWRLAAMSPIVTVGGSLITAMALAEEAVDFDAAWAVLSLDEQWQIEQWGEDAEAIASLENRRADVVAAVRFMELLD